MYKKIHSYHQKKLRNNIKVKVHKENIVTKSSFLNFSAIYCPIIAKFGEHLPFSIIYKFCKRDFSLQPPGDPREQHPGDTRHRTSSSKFFFLCKTIIQEKVKLLAYLWINHPEILLAPLLTFLSSHQGILENNIQVTLNKEHHRRKFFFFVNQSKTII